jgi:isopentenyldiphosphate isomerase
MVHDDGWVALVQRVAAADHTLTPEVVRDLVTWSSSATSPASSAEPEFLLPLDARGDPIPLPATVVDGGWEGAASGVEHDTWLRPTATVTPAGACVETLLVARWLPHRLGLRHRTVQLILDHPSEPSMTFIQVRGLDKAEAPGAFDMPCAGHVVGLDSAFLTLGKELGEELGLALEDLDALRPVGTYEYAGPEDEPVRRGGFHNVECRTVYRARLRTGALARVRFADDEVAALAMVPRTLLSDLAVRFPDRVASGLRGTLPWYRPWRFGDDPARGRRQR